MIRDRHRAARLLIASGSLEVQTHLKGVFGRLGAQEGVTWVSTQRRLVAHLWGPGEERVRPDVILLGLDLPDGDVGLLMERLGASHDLSRVPVLLLTARVFEAEDLARFGARGVLSPGVDAVGLWSGLTRLCGLGVVLTLRREAK